MDKRWKCQRCRRWIKFGEEQFLHGLPYGKLCYTKVVESEMKVQQTLLDISKESKETT